MDKQMRFDIVANAASAIQDIKNLNTEIERLKKNVGSGAFEGNTFSRLGASYKAQLSQLTAEAEKHYNTWKRFNDLDAKRNFENLIPSIRSLQREWDGFSKSIGTSHSNMNLLAGSIDRMKSHAAWITSGLMLAMAVELPLSMHRAATETELAMTKIKQNLEMAMPAAKLKEDLKQIQDAAMLYSTAYGVQLNQVLDGFSILSRRFKDSSSLVFLENLVLTLSKLDNIDPVSTANRLEAVVLQFGLDAKQTVDFVNQFTYAVHASRVTGTELLDALERSGSSFSNFNMGTAEAISLISTLTTITARSGSTVGNTYKSILTNLEGGYKKTNDILDQLGIKVYTLNDQGLSVMRSGEAILADILVKYRDLDDKGKSILANAVSGGKFQANQAKALLSEGAQVYTELLNNVKNANDELTGKLLATRLNTYNYSLEQMSAAFKVLAAIIGSEVMPALKVLVDGLNAGLIYLIDHKEQVGQFVSAIEKLGVGLLAWRAKNLLLNNSLLGVGAGVAGIYAMEGKYASAMKVMGEATVGFATTASAAITSALGRFFVLYAAIEVASEALRQFNDKSGLYKEEASLKEQIGYAKYASQYAGAYGYKGGTDVSALEARLAEVQQKIKEKEEAEEASSMNKYMERARKMAEAAQAAAKLAAHSNGGTATGTLEGPDKGGKGRRFAPDSSQELFRLGTGYDVNHALKEGKIAADAYSQAMEQLTTKEQIFGVSTDLTSQKINLMNSQILDLIAKAMQYEDMANDFEVQANEMINSNGQLKAALDAQKISWQSLTKEEKQEFVQQYRDYVQDEKTLLKLLDYADKLRVATAQAKKDASGIAANTVKVSLDDATSLYQKKIRELGYDESHTTYGLGRYASQQQKDVVVLKYAIEQLAVAQAELNRLEKDYGKDSERYKAQQVEIDKLKQKVEELGDKWQGVRNDLASYVVDMAQNGASLSQIWRKIFADFEREAIQRLFRVSNVQQSLLGSLLGLFGGGVTTGASTNMGNFRMAEAGRGHTGGFIGIDIPKFHSGGEIVPYFKNLKPDEIPIIGQAGEEINSRKDRRTIEIMAEQNKAMQEMIERMNNSQATTIVINAVDADSFANLLNKNGEAVVNVLRKQGALGNKY